MDANFRVGSAYRDITPETPVFLAGSMWVRETSEVLDPVFASSVVIDNNYKRIVFVSCDLCLLSDSICKRLRSLVSEAAGTSPENVAISCTHTHNGPSLFKGLPNFEIDGDMAESVFSRIVETALEASSRLSPAEMGYGSRDVPATFNRRLIVEGGRVIMSPGPQDPVVIRPEGPADKGLQAVWFRNEKGEILSIMINFSAHPTLSLGENLISADFPGTARRKIIDTFGKIPVLYFQGACGNTSPIDFTVREILEKNRLEIMEQTGAAIAESVIGIIKGDCLTYSTGVPLSSVSAFINLPARHAGKYDLSVEQARAYIEKHPIRDIDTTDVSTMLDYYFAESLNLLEGTGDFTEEYTVEISAYRMGDLAILAVPAELFAEYQLEIKKRSPFASTMVWELTNGYCGYIPTENALKAGSYEARLAPSSKLSSDAGRILVESGLKLLEKLKVNV